jgi:TrmH family RNA methyltransferase
MKQIISRQNPEITAVAALADAKGRATHGMFIAEGTRTCSALLDSSMKLVQLYALENLEKEALKIAHPNKITLVNQGVIEKISQATTPSGIVGVFYIPKQFHASQLTSGLVMARVSDPGNMGSLIRTCAALKIKSVVIVEGADVWSPKVIQATAGTIGLVNIYRMTWQDLVAHKGTLHLSALVTTGGKKPADVSAKDLLLVVGSEAHGIPQEWLADCDTQLTLPMPGNVESLNAAVAGSIALYAVHGR